MKQVVFSILAFNFLALFVPVSGNCQSTKTVNNTSNKVPTGNISLTEAASLFSTQPSRASLLNYSTVSGGVYNYTPVALSQPTSLSSTARVDIMPSDQMDFVVFPNPNKGILNIKGLVANEQQVKIVVTNMAGQTVYQSATIAIGGHINYQIQLPTNVAPGQYDLQVIAGNQQGMQRVVVE